MLALRIITLECLLFLASTCCALPGPEVVLPECWATQKIFNYQGIKINYYEAGRGSPIILLHGFGASAYSWRHLGPALARERLVYIIDLKGHGLSDKPQDGKYAVQDQAEMVAAFINDQGLQNLVLIGNSLGGAVALMTYFRVREQNPNCLNGLILIDSVGYPQKLPWFVRLARIPLLNAIGARLLPPSLVAGLVLRKCYYNDDKITDEAIAAYAHYGSLPGAVEAFVETAKQIIPQNMEALIAQYCTVRVPTLIIWGEQDEVIPLKVARNFNRDIPDSQLVILPHCGHIPHEEKPLETQRVINDFLVKRCEN